MANCRSGSFTLSFWSLNIRIKRSKQGYGSWQKIALIILQIRKRESWRSLRNDVAWEFRLGRRLGRKRLSQPLLGRGCLLNEDRRPKTQNRRPRDTKRIGYSTYIWILDLRFWVFGLRFVDTHMVGAGYNHLLSLRALESRAWIESFFAGFQIGSNCPSSNEHLPLSQKIYLMQIKMNIEKSIIPHWS